MWLVWPWCSHQHCKPFEDFMTQTWHQKISFLQHHICCVLLILHLWLSLHTVGRIKRWLKGSKHKYTIRKDNLDYPTSVHFQTVIQAALYLKALKTIVEKVPGSDRLMLPLVSNRHVWHRGPDSLKDCLALAAAKWQQTSDCASL